MLSIPCTRAYTHTRMFYHVYGWFAYMYICAPQRPEEVILSDDSVIPAFERKMETGAGRNTG